MAKRHTWGMAGLMAVLMVSCTPPPGPQSNQTGNAPAVEHPSAQVVNQDPQVLVGGAEVPLAGIVLDTDGPCTVQVTFAAPVKGITAEEALRAGLPASVDVRFDWVSDRSVHMAVPAGGSFTINATGTELLGGEILRTTERLIRRPTEKELRFYSPEGLMAGRETPEASYVYRIWVNGLRVHPSGRYLILYNEDPLADHGPRPYLFDLSTGEGKYLQLPTDDQVYRFAGWLPDGGILLAGQAVWGCLATGDGCQQVSGEPGRACALAPSGKELALWADDELHLIDLTTGSKRSLANAHPAPAGGAASVGWSEDGSLLAVTTAGQSGAQSPEIRMIRATDGAIDGEVDGVYLVGWHGGVLFGWQPPASTSSQGAGTLLAFDAGGRPVGTYPGNARPSPNGRFVVWTTRHDAQCLLTLADRKTGAVSSVQVPGCQVRWTDRGTLLTITDRGH